MLLFTSALSLALAAVPAAAASHSVSAGYTSEDYSFANSGAGRWIEGRSGFAAWSALGRVESLRRFGQSDQGGALGASWKGSGQGLTFWLGGSPSADIMARGFAEASWARALRRGLYMEASTRAADYRPANVYAGSLSAFWQARDRLEINIRFSETMTRFRSAGDKIYPGALARAKLGSSETIWFQAALGAYKEAFEAGAPGGTGAFTAAVYGLEAGLALAPGWKVRAGLEYEDRDNGTFVRRWTAGAVVDF